MLRNLIGKSLVVTLALVGVLTGEATAQQLSKFDRSRAQGMLEMIAKDVSKHYYDPKFHGVDWHARVALAKQQIDQSDSMNMALSHIAAALDSLNDSHTFFVPPQRPFRQDYGWQTEIIGDQCYITEVEPGSDGEAKGVKPGDQVLKLNGYPPDRSNLWKMDYVYRLLRPQPGLRFTLLNGAGQQREVDVMASRKDLPRVRDVTGNGVWDLVREMENEEHQRRVRWMDLGDDLMIVKFPEFLFDQSEVESLIGKARKHKALILDLRGNPGGAVETLRYMIGGVFDREIKIADQAGREKSKPLVAKSMGHNSFTGKLVVLVDSKSASAAELFARVVQLEKRGAVLGDRSSGSVMEAKQYGYQMGEDTVIFYGASITEFDLIMADGKSLEHAGVTPDEVVLPSGMDLTSGRDPVLARAAATLNVKLTPEAAGKLFPYEWPKQ
jgi:carboxyl-terminal processing protease